MSNGAKRKVRRKEATPREKAKNLIVSVVKNRIGAFLLGGDHKPVKSIERIVAKARANRSWKEVAKRLRRLEKKTRTSIGVFSALN